jgi:hypothetical protein
LYCDLVRIQMLTLWSASRHLPLAVRRDLKQKSLAKNARLLYGDLVRIQT